MELFFGPKKIVTVSKQIAAFFGFTSQDQPTWTLSLRALNNGLLQIYTKEHFYRCMVRNHAGMKMQSCYIVANFFVSSKSSSADSIIEADNAQQN